MAIEVFNRCEKKYMLDKEQYEAVINKMSSHMEVDAYNKDNKFYMISNIYYDTPDDRLIRASIEKPAYKEKMRVRSYGVPGIDDNVFVEIKKKYNGIVNKRRTGIKLGDAYDYLDGKITAGMLEKKNERINRQVLGEIDYFKHFYNLQPKLYLSYERMAYFEKNDGSFRVTFDTDITTRRHDVRLELGSYGKKIIPENMFLMEIKINKAVPIWFTKILSEYDIYPVSFSKYGTEYKQYIMENLKRKDEFVCLNQFLQQQQTIQSMLGIGTAVLLGLIIGIAYMFMCRKERYNRDFIIGLVILPAIVAAVILLIGSNVARAFSMAGAFALVRFRSVPGSAKDIAIVFFAMASGLACGLGYVTFACVFVVIMIVILILLTVFNFAQPHTDIKQLRITIPESLNYSDVFDEVMNKFTEKAELRKVKTTNMGTMFELSYNVVVKGSVNEKEFIDNLRMRNGNLNISLSVGENDNNNLN